MRFMLLFEVSNLGLKPTLATVQSIYPGLGPLMGSAYLFYTAIGVVLLSLSTILSKKWPHCAQQSTARAIVCMLLTVCGLGLLYQVNLLEIASYFELCFQNSRVEIAHKAGMNYHYRFNSNIFFIGQAWSSIYRLLFAGLVAIFVLKNHVGKLMPVLAALFFIFQIGDFSIRGLDNLASLRDSYLHSTDPYSIPLILNLYMRYIVFVALGSSFIPYYLLSKGNQPSKIAFDLLLYLTLIIVGISEIINILAILKLPLLVNCSITIFLQGTVLFVFIVSRYQHKKHIQFLSYFLAGITLLKMALFDLGYLEMDILFMLIINLIITTGLLIFAAKKIR